ncbi:MAG: hypothetical protein HY868_16585 [Chloroflexi bacterium]|nr:hypothetical protein [Chloroflexota bacterium]
MTDLVAIDLNRLWVIPFRVNAGMKCGHCGRPQTVNAKMFEIWKGKAFLKNLCPNCNERRKRGQIQLEGASK